MSLTISAVSSPQYYGQFVHELASRFGRPRFTGPDDYPQLRGPRDGMYAVIPDGRRLFFSTDDLPNVNLDALNWCDVYGMVNLLPEHRDLPGGSRLMPLGPSFGVRWVPQLSGFRCLFEAIRADENRFAPGLARIRSFAKHQRERSPLSAYQPKRSSSNYLFFAATYWANHPEANRKRIELWRSLKQDTTWLTEGGFVGAPEGIDPPLQLHRPYSHRQFLERTQQSCVALNTSAVHGCLGWKLGEYLALGKAIVTEPVRQLLPMPLDTCALIAKTTEEAIDLCNFLRSNENFRHSLEDKSRRYFLDFVTPRAAINRMLSQSETK